MISAVVRRCRFLSALSILIFSSLLSGCLTEQPAKYAEPALSTPRQATPSADSPSLPYLGIAEPILRIQGSNTIGASLAPALAKAFLISLGAQSLDQFDGEGNQTQVVGTLSDNRKIQILIAAQGSSTGFKALYNGTADIAAASRQITDKEVAQLVALGDLTSVDGEHILGIDGLAIIVHPSNPVSHLSLTQLRQVFSGAISDWRELGGLPGTIKVLARDDNSGTYDTFKHLVLTNGDRLTEDAQRYESNQQLAQDVASNPNAIGFVALASADGVKVLGISDGDATPLKPEQISVATEDYPLSRRLYFYSATDIRNPVAKDFIHFALSRDGQQLVEQEGFVSQVPSTHEVQPSATDPEHFTRLTQNAQRLSVNFRFRPNSWELDNKAQRDVLRLAEFILQSDLDPERLMLIGFSEQRRDELGAQILSEHRAKAVQKALEEQGIQIHALSGYGHYRAVASQESLQARMRNNRVEVWLRTPAP